MTFDPNAEPKEPKPKAIYKISQTEKGSMDPNNNVYSCGLEILGSGEVLFSVNDYCVLKLLPNGTLERFNIARYLPFIETNQRGQIRLTES